MSFRLRFSLRTLLLASLFAGGVMLVLRVREPWTLKVYPAEAIPPSYENLQTDNLAFSPSGRFLAVNRFSNLGFIVDTDSRKIVDTLYGDPHSEWHPSRDLFVHKISEKGYRVSDYAAQKTLCEMSADRDYAVFSHKGKFVIERREMMPLHFRLVCDTTDWKRFEEPRSGLDTIVITSFSAWRDISADDRLALAVISHEEAGAALQAIDTETREIKWQWTPENVVSTIDARFKDANTVQVKCQYDTLRRRIVDGEIDPKYAKRVAARDRPQVSYELMADSGKEKSKNILVAVWNALTQSPKDEALDAVNKRMEKFTKLRGMLDSTYFPPPIFSPDTVWKIAISADAKSLELSDTKSGELLYRLPANEEKLIGDLHISADSRRIATIAHSGSVLVWTPTRGHVQWWGIYELPESWFAAALFAALLWSFVRDCRHKKSASPSVIPSTL